MGPQVSAHVEKARRPLRVGWGTQAEDCTLNEEASPTQVKSLRLRDPRGG